MMHRRQAESADSLSDTCFIPEQLEISREVFCSNILEDIGSIMHLMRIPKIYEGSITLKRNRK